MAARKIKIVGPTPEALEILVLLTDPITLNGPALVAQFAALTKAHEDATHIAPALRAVTTVIADRAHAAGVKTVTVECVTYKVDAVKGSTHMTLVPPRKAREAKPKALDASTPVDASTLD